MNYLYLVRTNMKNNSLKLTDHYLAGQWIQGEGNKFTSINPADGSIIWQGKQATQAEIEAASAAAHKALANWSSLDFFSRSRYLQNFATIVKAKSQELTQLIALETGKPLWEALTEVNSVIAKVNLSIQASEERTAEKETTAVDAKAWLRYKPHGVIAVLGAFNFPAHLSNGHIVPALLSGNTILYKPSELTPAVAQFIMNCWHESGIPHGVINCIQGDGNVAKALLTTDIQGVYFTGSYHTGKQIHQYFSERPEVILALEMGGNNPLIIDEVADINAAVYSSLLSSMLTAGQRCTCARRIIIPDNSFGEQFLLRFIEACRNLTIGKFTDKPEPFMGPVISHQHAISHLNAQQTLKDMGGKALLSMTLLAENTGFLSPGIIDMTKAIRHPDEEIFAPLVQIYRYHDFAEALRLANQTRYGLAAGLISDHNDHYQQFYQTIRAGLINWNRPTTGAAGNLPFGGVGLSGNHRPSAYFATDYCSYPIASLEQAHLTLPKQLLPGINLI